MAAFELWSLPWWREWIAGIDRADSLDLIERELDDRRSELSPAVVSTVGAEIEARRKALKGDRK